MIHRPRGRARKRCLVWSWESPLVGGGWIDFRALHARPLEGKQRLCKLRLCLLGTGASDGTPAFALFHSRSRGRKLLDRGGAALAHRAALVEPADSRSGVGGWCVKLLERRARGVVLTAAGKVFLDHARLALSQVEAAAEGARRAEQPHTTSCPARKPITNTGFSGRLWVRMRTTQVSKTSPLYPLMADIRADIDF